MAFAVRSPARASDARRRVAMKSLKKQMSKAMAGVGMNTGTTAAPSGVAAWEDFSDFSNAVPIASGAKPTLLTTGFTGNDDPHPLTKDWSNRIKNPKVRSAFLKQSIESYTTKHDLNVWTGTWNTNGKSPPGGLDISQWLDVSDKKPDVVVVGFQEIVPLTPGKVLMQEDSVATAEWEAIIDRTLNGKGSEAGPATNANALSAAATNNWTTFGDDAGSGVSMPGGNNGAENQKNSKYVRIACKQLVGVYITVWVTDITAAHCRDVRTATVSTGVNLGVTMLGNKGGAAMWLKIYNTPLCFICAHLSAGSKENDAQKRSEDYHEINGKLTFPASTLAASSDGTFEKPSTIGDAFCAVWIGDLNYRLNLVDDVVRQTLAGDAPTASESKENAIINSPAQTLKHKKYALLLAYDQLLLERSAGKAFSGWVEAPVSFPPTYKYRPGTSTYSGAGDADEEETTDNNQNNVKISQKEEKKKRTPAWCDRILYKGRDITQISYGRSELTQSDHKPVFSEFTVTARELLPERLQHVLQETRRELDAQEMASQPRCTVENPRRSFSVPLKFAEKSSTVFRLINTGDVPAQWNFVAAVPGETAVAPPWLTVQPTQGNLLPGEETVITATALVVGGGQAGPTALAQAAGMGDFSTDQIESNRQSLDPSTSSKTSASTPAGNPAVVMPTSSAGSIAEAARVAQARAVSAGIAKVEAGGGVSMVSPGSRGIAGATKSNRGSAVDLLNELAETTLGTPYQGDDMLSTEKEIPVDAILVLHLSQGRDFFLTVSGSLSPSVFGKALWQLQSVSFPPNVPSPVAALVDYLFASTCGVEVFQVPDLGTVEGLSSVRQALDTSTDLSATPNMNPHQATFALLTLFASLPKPLFASTTQCLQSIDLVMQPWSQAAAQAAGAAAACRAPWTLATEYLQQALPSLAVAESLLASHLRVSERAAYAHTISWIRQSLKSGGASVPGAAARVASQLAEVWFPRPAPGAADAAATRMGRVAFVGALCGIAPNALDGFNPMETLFDVEFGGGTGGTGTMASTAATPATAATGVGLAGMMGIVGGGGLGTGNLIDF